MLNRGKGSDKLVVIGSVVGLIVLLVVFMFVANIISNFAQSLMPLVAGSLLLLGNRREMFELVRTRKPSAAAMNAMIGLAMICFGLGVAFFGGSAFRFILYLPGTLLLLAAAPLALGKPSIYNTYRNWMGSTKDAFSRTRKPKAAKATPQNFPSQQQPASQDTIRLDEDQVNPTYQPRQ